MNRPNEHGTAVPWLPRDSGLGWFQAKLLACVSVTTHMSVASTWEIQNGEPLLEKKGSAVPALHLEAIERVFAPPGEASESLVPQELAQQICGLECAEDWDEEGAGAITSEACQAAVRLVGSLLAQKPDVPLPQISGSLVGAVSLYWRSGDRHFVARVPSNDPESIFFQENALGGFRNHGTEDRAATVNRILAFLG